MTKTRKNNKPIKGGHIGPIHSLIKYIIKFALKNISEEDGHSNMFYNKLKRMDCYEDLMNDIAFSIGNIESINEHINNENINNIFERRPLALKRDFLKMILKEAGLYTDLLFGLIIEDRVITDKMKKIFKNQGLNTIKRLPPSIINQLGVENMDELAGHFERDKISPFPSSPRTMKSDSM